MLVLSRHQNEKIVFPHLGITVEILRISGNTVRVGVDAPRDVAVLREELAADAQAETARARRDFRHTLRNRLNAANLCLYLVKKQIEQHKPREAEQTLEKALTAFAALDLEISEATQQPGLKLPKPTLRALLVEDDANESELMAGLLRISGFEVATASDGDRALDYLSAHRRPDVVLLDMVMPRCDGPTTLSAIRNNPQYEGLKVVAVSGSAPGEAGVSIGPHGVDQWFVKPIHPEKLVSRLHECLDGEATVGAKMG